MIIFQLQNKGANTNVSSIVFYKFCGFPVLASLNGINLLTMLFVLTGSTMFLCSSKDRFILFSTRFSTSFSEACSAKTNSLTKICFACRLSFLQHLLLHKYFHSSFFPCFLYIFCSNYSTFLFH